MDTGKLRNLVEAFEFNSKPANTDNSALCTVGDIRKVIANVATLLKEFVNELEEKE